MTSNMNNKKNSSLSCSPSSSSSLAFDPIMCNSKVSTPVGCLSSVLRRILCSDSFSTHPSDQIQEFDPMVMHDYQEMESKERGSSPGIVARLMGLDTLPDFGRISRSRSMNSADSSMNCDREERGHRRVKSSSLTFHEMPSFVEMEDDKFFILSFENSSDCKEKKCELKKRRHVKSRRNKENRKEENQEINKNAQNENELCRGIPSKPCQDVLDNGEVETVIRTPLGPKTSSNKPNSAVEAVKKSRFTEKYEGSDGSNSSIKRRVKRVEHECSSSEDSSPISVLDFEDASRLGDLNSRRKLSPELEDHGRHQSSDDDNISSPDEKITNRFEYKCLPQAKLDCDNQRDLDSWSEICRLARAEVTNSEWINGREVSNSEDVKDIGTEFCFRILDQLVDEFIDQLSGLHMKL